MFGGVGWWFSFSNPLFIIILYLKVGGVLELANKLLSTLSGGRIFVHGSRRVYKLSGTLVVSLHGGAPQSLSSACVESHGVSYGLFIYRCGALHGR